MLLHCRTSHRACKSRRQNVSWVEPPRILSHNSMITIVGFIYGCKFSYQLKYNRLLQIGYCAWNKPTVMKNSIHYVFCDTHFHFGTVHFGFCLAIAALNFRAQAIFIMLYRFLESKVRNDRVLTIKCCAQTIPLFCRLSAFWIICRLQIQNTPLLLSSAFVKKLTLMLVQQCCF